MDINLQKETDYLYRTEDGFVDITTLSPSGQHYYRVKPFIALNKSAFGCKIAFFESKKKQLVYYRDKTYAHELHDKEEIEFARHKMELGEVGQGERNSSLIIVKWSRQGNIAYLLEHYSWNNNELYESVFLDLKESHCYRIDEIQNNFKIVDGLNLRDREYDEEAVIKKFDELDLAKQSLIKDEILKRSILDNILNTNKWYPDL